MSSILIAFLMVLIAPLLLSNWRVSLLGLALQGLIMGWLVVDRGLEPSAGAVVLLLDLLVVRGLWVPRHLHAIQRRTQAPSRNDVIPANLLSWTLAGALIVLAFRFADLVVPGDVAGSSHVAVATAAVLLGFLVLSTQNSPFSQIIGVLRLENGIVLFELATPGHLPLAVQVALAVVYVLTVVTFGRFLLRADALTVSSMPPSPGPRL